MIIMKWLHSVLVGNRPEIERASAGISSQELKKFRKKKKRYGSIDLANAALINHAEDLEDLIASGSSFISRKRLKRKIRRRVERAMCEELSNPKIIDEVTERITDAAEIDPYYERLFCQNAEE